MKMHQVYTPTIDVDDDVECVILQNKLPIRRGQWLKFKASSNNPRYLKGQYVTHDHEDILVSFVSLNEHEEDFKDRTERFCTLCWDCVFKSRGPAHASARATDTVSLSEVRAYVRQNYKDAIEAEKSNC